MRLFLLSISLFVVNIGMAAKKPAAIAKTQLISDYAAFETAVEKLTFLGESEGVNWETVQHQFFNARLAYKKVELFMAYLDGEFVKDHINGAPLPHIERKAPNLVVFDPSGFQIMEEVLMEQDAAAFFDLADELNKHVIILGKGISPAFLSERMVVEAMREAVIRLTAMGITGFDTPSTLNTMAECETVFKSLETTTNLYYSYLDQASIDRFNALFKEGYTYFNTADYNSFNRFDFIRNVTNPLYGLILNAQQQLNIETRDLVYKTEFSVNYAATSMFDTDFLNYRYFSSYSNSGNEEERRRLGKLLFFDPLLSHNNERACASCHHADKAFSDGLKTSERFNHDGVLKRNAPGLINAVYNTRFFWDARAETPEQQVEHVLFNPDEFNSNYDEVTAKIKSCEEYLDRFERAYPTINKINRYTIVASLSAYIQSLRSYDSAFDLAIRNEKTADEKMQQGFNLFTGKGKCATCHFVPTFAGNVPPNYTDTETEILGIPNVNDRLTAALDDDLGRFSNGRPQETANYNKHAFKTPTLRNIALTAPYMHNGVFNTLQEVVDYYNIGGGHGWGIAPENTTLGADSLNLSELEMENLIFFMEALTDTVGLTSRPSALPKSAQENLNSRKVGGLY